MNNSIDELKQVLLKKRREGNWDMQPFHWFYLEGFAAAIEEPFEIREAKARLHFYRNAPIYIMPNEYIVGQIDWNEPLICTFTNTHVREDILERIRNSNVNQA